LRLLAIVLAEIIGMCFRNDNALGKSEAARSPSERSGVAQNAQAQKRDEIRAVRDFAGKPRLYKT
jgi:hypothetical protein